MKISNVEVTARLSGIGVPERPFNAGENSFCAGETGEVVAEVGEELASYGFKLNAVDNGFSVVELRNGDNDGPLEFNFLSGDETSVDSQFPVDYEGFPTGRLERLVAMHVRQKGGSGSQFVEVLVGELSEVRQRFQLQDGWELLVDLTNQSPLANEANTLHEVSGFRFGLNGSDAEMEVLLIFGRDE